MVDCNRFHELLNYNGKIEYFYAEVFDVFYAEKNKLGFSRFSEFKFTFHSRFGISNHIDFVATLGMQCDIPLYGVTIAVGKI